MQAAITQNAQLVIKQLERPVATAGTIVIKNKYSGINYADNAQIVGSFPAGAHNIIGLESVGQVVEVGEGVTEFQVGDRVIAVGADSHAEFSLLKDLEAKTVKIPEGISDEKVAALAVQGLTAIVLLELNPVVQKGDFALVHAAAGGVGYILIQLLHRQGVIVIGSTSSDEKAAFAKQQGADHVINYKKEKVLERVLEITNGKGVKLVLDSVGGSQFEDSVNAIGYNGLVISFGHAAGPPAPLNLMTLYRKNAKVQATSLYNDIATKEQAQHWWARFFELIKNDEIKEHIYKTYTFENIGQAISDIVSGQTIGKLLIKFD